MRRTAQIVALLAGLWGGMVTIRIGWHAAGDAAAFTRAQITELHDDDSPTYRRLPRRPGLK